MKKNKLIAVIICAVLVVLTLSLELTACDKADPNDPKTIVVGASASPHAEILNAIKGKLKEQGYNLVVKVFDDYVTPNTALDEGSLNANYFQHTPYLNTFNAQNNTDLVAVEKIHYEPFCVYGNNVTKEDYDQNKTGRTILIPNDGSNLTRALFVLQDEGFITLADDADPNKNLTVKDIKDTKNNTIKPLEANLVSLTLDESDAGTIAVINGNYALQDGRKIENALGIENAQGEAAQLYANVIAVKSGHENDAKIKALVDALKSQEVIDFINNTYGGAVVPSFTL